MYNLNKIQKELKSPKGQFNSFANFKYRSCEDILEAVKPLLDKAILTVSDDIVQVGDRYYVKATATYEEKDFIKSVSAFAREPLEKTKMDVAQVTGTSSSYARKYALNGLFCIDDTKDADTQDNTTKSPAKATTSPTTAIETPFVSARTAISTTDDLDGLIKLKEHINKSKKLTDTEKNELSEILTNKIQGYDPL